MVYMNHFIDMFEPAPDKLWISVVNENHTKSTRKSRNANGLNFSMNCIPTLREQQEVATTVARESSTHAKMPIDFKIEKLTIEF